MLLFWICSTLFIMLIKYAIKYRYIFNRDIYKNFSNNHVPWIKSGFGIAFLNPVEIFDFLRNVALKYQKSYKVTAFGITNYCIIRAKDAEKVLSTSKHLNKGFIYSLLHPFLRTGLLTSTAPKWHMRRKLLIPAFHFNVLKEYFKIFKEESERLIEKLKSENGNEVDIIHISSRFALKSVCEATMGVNLSSINENGNKYLESLCHIAHMCADRFSKPWLYNNSMYAILGYRKKFDQLLESVHEFTKTIIENRKIEFNKKKILEQERNSNIIDNFSENKQAAMLDILLQAQSEGKINEKGIYEEIDTFTFEGHDTTAAAMTYTLLLLAHHPDIQQKLLEEIMDIIDEYDDLTLNQLHKMNFMERVIKESLRLYPPVPFIARTLSEDIFIDDAIIKKGTAANIFIYDVHRDPEYYPDPEKFDPDRFLLENCDKRHKFAYLPFSAGMRNCIGQRFSMLELKTMLTRIVQNFRILPVTSRDELVFKADVVLRSRDPIKMKFIPRN